MYLKTNNPDFAKNLDKTSNKPTIQTFEKEDILLKIKWVFFFLMIILAIEWGIRKRIGGTA